MHTPLDLMAKILNTAVIQRGSYLKARQDKAVRRSEQGLGPRSLGWWQSRMCRSHFQDQGDSKPNPVMVMSVTRGQG